VLTATSFTPTGFTPTKRRRDPHAQHGGRRAAPRPAGHRGSDERLRVCARRRRRRMWAPLLARAQTRPRFRRRHDASPSGSPARQAQAKLSRLPTRQLAHRHAATNRVLRARPLRQQRPPHEIGTELASDLRDATTVLHRPLDAIDDHSGLLERACSAHARTQRSPAAHPGQLLVRFGTDGGRTALAPHA
jgi:hypothetical protein